MSSTSLMQKPSILLEDFNMHHNNLDLHTQNFPRVARQFAKKVTTNGGDYSLAPGTKTYQQKNSLDPVTASGQLSSSIRECYIEDDLVVTSNHKFIITSFYTSESEEITQLLNMSMFKNIYEKAFFNSLQMHQDTLWQNLEMTQNTQTHLEEQKANLDLCTQHFLDFIYQSIPDKNPTVKLSEEKKTIVE